MGGLHNRYPILFSFAKNKFCTAASQFTDDWQLDLHSNLSRAASLELQELSVHLACIHLRRQDLDVRSATFSKHATTSYFYRLNTFTGIAWAPYKYVWHPIIPEKYSVFLWLAFKDRLNTRHNMIKKCWNVSFHAGCESCPALETTSHIMLRCREAQLVWRHLGYEQLATDSEDPIQFVSAVETSAEPYWYIVFASLAVTLWSLRNAKVFDGLTTNWATIKKQIFDTLSLWSTRAKKNNVRDGVLVWANKFS